MRPAVTMGSDKKGILFVNNDDPCGSERLYNSLHQAVEPAKYAELQVWLFLVSDAAQCAVAG